ncbi:hypothetical protein APR04_004617 [Promicromonospora umidemergens]|uniref:MFS transporter n=1 Tax=Promicromonospora umidemergens TaxID=629679 RepID=A0ABP8XL66_9MICO|nr:hypothetical protein [Promicromonospora umidemergens]MCP2285682.1 hypothetical protein [Promicromonospora umidemergens]
MLASLALCCLVFAGVQSVLTYLVPYLGDVTGVTGPVVVGVLFAFGVATTVGSAAGSRFADAHAALALQCGTSGLTVSLFATWTPTPDWTGRPISQWPRLDAGHDDGLGPGNPDPSPVPPHCH